MGQTGEVQAQHLRYGVTQGYATVAPTRARGFRTEAGAWQSISSAGPGLTAGAAAGRAGKCTPPLTGFYANLHGPLESKPS